MNAIYKREPKFRPKQRVTFVGGEGIIRRCISKLGRWVYLIEMALGLEPEFGRIGAETMVLLEEEDLCAA
jgi:hypothetical protein